MPLISNHRQEAFAQALARGAAHGPAYVAAGYKESTKASWELAQNVKIVRRVEEVRRELQDKAMGLLDTTNFNPADVTVDWMIGELYKQVLIGREQGDLMSSNKALEMMGKLTGVLERPRIGRPPRGPAIINPPRREAEDLQETVGLLEQLDNDA